MAGCSRTVLENCWPVIENITSAVLEKIQVRFSISPVRFSISPVRFSISPVRFSISLVWSYCKPDIIALINGKTVIHNSGWQTDSSLTKNRVLSIKKDIKRKIAGTSSGHSLKQRAGWTVPGTCSATSRDSRTSTIERAYYYSRTVLEKCWTVLEFSLVHTVEVIFSSTGQQFSSTVLLHPALELRDTSIHGGYGGAYSGYGSIDLMW